MNNLVILRGVNLTRDAETIQAGGKPCVKFGVAVNNGYKDARTGEWVKLDPDYIDVEAWSLPSEVYPLLTKGARVVVVGKLKYQAWEDKSGGKRSKVFVRADSVDVISRGDKQQVAPFEPGGYSPPQAYAQTQAMPEFAQTQVLPPLDSDIPF
jgi:single stranded DNA-binding protein